MTCNLGHFDVTLRVKRIHDKVKWHFVSKFRHMRHVSSVEKYILLFMIQFDPSIHFFALEVRIIRWRLSLRLRPTDWLMGF